MAQVAGITLPDGLFELRDTLEAHWPQHVAALRASGAPLNLYEDLDDEQLRARARDLGITVADDADRSTVEQAIAAKEKKQTPPWGSDEDFDAAKAWTLIENLRNDRKKDRDRLEELEKQERERNDAAKTEEQRREEAQQLAQKEAKDAKIEAARLRVALAKGLTETQAKRLVGETQEELEADADELLATFKTDDDDSQELDGHGRPRERTPRSGAAPNNQTGVDTDDPDKLAAQVPRRFA